jgi:hypothetical protein
MVAAGLTGSTGRGMSYIQGSMHCSCNVLIYDDKRWRLLTDYCELCACLYRSFVYMTTQTSQPLHCVATSNLPTLKIMQVRLDRR